MLCNFAPREELHHLDTDCRSETMECLMYCELPHCGMVETGQLKVLTPFFESVNTNYIAWFML